MSGVASTVGKIAGVVAAGALLVGAVATGNPALAAVATKIATLASIASPAAENGSFLPVRSAMTAISLFEDGNSAFVLSDTAMLDADGVVRGFASKVIMLPEVRLAIAINGRPIMYPLIEAMNRSVLLPLQASFLAGLPAAFSEVMRKIASANPDAEAKGANATRLWIAAFDEQAKRPRIYTLGNNRVSTLNGSPLEPRCMSEVKSGYTTPSFDRVNLPFGRIANPKRDGRRMIMAQRQHRFDNGHYCVGGHAELYTINGRGVSVQRVAEWPDRVGKRIKP